jgi:phosphoribosylformimino-5-aminoimidazole carboxamide ribotide isomerase
MDVIPVIDLKDGVVVHARMGIRAHYRPIATPLAPSSVPLDVVGGLLSLYPFATLYVADLDAITGTGNNRNVVQSLRHAFPFLGLWVDSGIANQTAADDWLGAPGAGGATGAGGASGAGGAPGAGLGDLVLGSETLIDDGLIRHFAGRPDVVLSLDFRGDAFQGPPELLADPAAWPHRVIVMTLARVGSNAGPDFERLRDIRDRAPGHAVYAAGGVRDTRDLMQLKCAGIAGALIASSLHDGRVRGADIAMLAQAD